MKAGFVVMADQEGSRRHGDRVPAALARLHRTTPARLAFERTAGDELQGLVDSPRAVVDAVVALAPEGWHHAGDVTEASSVWNRAPGQVFLVPVPDSTRAARGTAYLAAREALAAARSSATALALRTVGTDDYRADEVADAEAALRLVRAVLARRTGEGWQIVDLYDEGLTGAQAARRLGISPSAVSQRLRRAAHDEVGAGERLARRLLARAAGATP